MTKNETIHVRVNSTVKSNAESALDLLGVSNNTKDKGNLYQYVDEATIK